MSIKDKNIINLEITLDDEQEYDYANLSDEQKKTIKHNAERTFKHGIHREKCNNCISNRK